jgi:hypothetical protein
LKSYHLFERPEETLYRDNPNRNPLTNICLKCFLRLRQKKSKNAYSIFKSYQDGASLINLDFPIVYEDYLLWKDENCFNCGLKDIKLPSIGLDRVKNLKGYLIDNIVPCCSICNIRKLSQDPLSFIEKCKDITFAQQTGNCNIKHQACWPINRKGPEENFENFLKISALRKNPCTVDMDESELKLIKKDPCSYCLTTERRRGLDRVDNKKRCYQKDLIVPCCFPCNCL